MSHSLDELTHWGRVTHICVNNLSIIGSVDGLSPGRRQAIIWTNAGTLLIGPLGTNFSEILITILTFLFKKMSEKMLSEKWQPSCLGLNELMDTLYPAPASLSLISSNNNALALCSYLICFDEVSQINLEYKNCVSLLKKNLCNGLHVFDPKALGTYFLFEICKLIEYRKCGSVLDFFDRMLPGIYSSNGSFCWKKTMWFGEHCNFEIMKARHYACMS